MKKIFTFLVAFLATLSGAVWAEGLGSSDNYYDITQYQKVLEIDDSEEYYLTGSNNYGIRVKAGGSSIGIGGDNRNKPHIYLKDVSFGSVNAPMGGSAIIIENRTVVTITIEEENSIVSNGTSDAAIKLETGEGFNTAELIFDGTGHLDINMLGGSSVNQVAIGERGLGLDALHNCGSLTINGGTITTNGYIGEFDSHAFRMNGNGIVVAKDIVTSGIHKNWLVDSGIYYETEEGQDALNVVGNVTINSPIPDENIYIGTGNSLTLGEGDVLDADKVTIDGGTLNAYKVSYDLNKSVGSKTITVADEAPYGTYYCGNKTALLEGPNATNSEPSWHNLGWANNTSIMTATPDPVPGSVTEAANQITAKAIWAVNQWTTVQVTAGEKMETPISLLYPSDITGISFEEETKGVLDTYGAKIEGTKVVAGDNGAGDANEKAENVTLKIKVNNSEVSGKTTIIPFKVNNDAPDLSDESVTKVDVTDVVYSGKAVEDSKVITNITVNEISNLGTDLFVVKYSFDDKGSAIIDAPTNQGIYYVFIQAKEGATNYQKASKPQQFKITPRPMTIDINKLTAEELAGITTETEITISEADVDFEDFNAEKESGIVADEESDAKLVGKITVAPVESTKEGKKAYTITLKESKLENGENGQFIATNYKASYTYNGEAFGEDGTIEITIDDLNPGDVDPDDGDDDGNDWSFDGYSYTLIYDGKPHGVEFVTVKDESGEIIDNKDVVLKSVVYSQELDEGGFTPMGPGEMPKNVGRYQAEVLVSVKDELKTATIPLFIFSRPLRVDFDLTDLDESVIGHFVLAEECVNYNAAENNVANAGLVVIDGEREEPLVEGKFHIAGTPNEYGKYDITPEGVELKDMGLFIRSNYEISLFVNGELLVDNDGDGEYDKIDGDSGADIDEDGSSIGGIGTNRYRLYLANKDYNVVDAKADYAAEGLELFSRHDKKYTKVGGSFTVWYEKDGVANAGGYRIFWSNKANGDYKEVKFDTVSEYFQIRNVQSNVYVKIYAADGFPVGNEEISAADYRAYAQPNKIVVITPQPTDVQIISMAGAVVATDKVTGQREFANLTEGVYIVRMGETVVKLQVRK